MTPFGARTPFTARTPRRARFLHGAEGTQPADSFDFTPSEGRHATESAEHPPCISLYFLEKTRTWATQNSLSVDQMQDVKRSTAFHGPNVILRRTIE